MQRRALALLLLAALPAAAQVIVPDFGETRLLVPLGVDPPPDIAARIAAAPACATPDTPSCRENISLAAFQVEVTLPVGLTSHFANDEILIAIESETAPGHPAPQVPADLPRAHLRRRSADGSDDPRPASIRLRSIVPQSLLPNLRTQDGANRFVSPWIVLIADPRASVDYEWPEEITPSATGCRSCARPVRLKGKKEADGVFELRPTGDWLRIRLDVTDAEMTLDPVVRMLAERIDTRVRTLRADLVRPAPDLLASRTPPPGGMRMEQSAMLHTGEIAFSHTDFGIRARNSSLGINRIYGSAITHLGPFGRNMDSPLFARLRPLFDGSVELYDGTGRMDRFTPEDETRYRAPKGVFLDLRRDGEGWVLLGRDDSRAFFDPQGRLVRLSDANTLSGDGSDGNSFRLFYDAAGRLETILDPIGRPLILRYGVGGLVSEIEDSAGRVVWYEYDERARLTRVHGPDPKSSRSREPSHRYVWSDPVAGDPVRRALVSGQLRQQIDGELRIVEEAQFDPQRPWAATTITSGGGSWILSSAGPVTSVVDPIGTTVHYTHDAEGRVVKIEMGEAVTTFAFDGEGRLIETVEPEGEKTLQAYDAEAPERRHAANVTEIRQTPRPGTAEAQAGAERKTTFAWADGRLASTTSPGGETQSVIRDLRGNPQTVTDPSGVATTNVYDEHGLLRSTSDPRSGTTTFDYETLDPSRIGSLRRVTAAGGTSLVETDARGNVVQVTDAAGRTASFVYNELDQPEVEIRQESRAESEYDATGAIVKRKELLGADADGLPLWSESVSQIDAVGRLLMTASEGAITTWTYDPSGNTLSMAGPGGPPTTYSYDGNGRIATLAIGDRVTSYAYDRNGASTSVTDALGHTTHFLIDGFGASVGTVDPAGIQQIERHDASGRAVDSRVVKLVDGGPDLLLRWTTREFDVLGRMTKETRKLFTDPLPLPEDGSDPAGAADVVVRTVYDDEARTVTRIDPLGHSSKSEMDEFGRVVRTTDPMGNRSETDYGPAGNVVEERRIEAGSEGRTWVTRWEYDEMGRVAAVHDRSDPDHPRVTRYAYDVRSQLVRVTDPEQRVTRFEYDARGRRTKLVDPSGAFTTFAWDDADRLVELRDPNGNPTRWEYSDETGQLEREIRADGATWVYTWDVMGRRETATDPNGSVMTFGYDALDRLTSVSIARGAGVEGPSSITYVLDDLGRVVAAETDEGVRVTSSFDSLDRELVAAISIDGVTRAVERSYDPASRPVGLRYPSGLALTQSFDPLGRLSEVKAGDALMARWRDVGSRRVERIAGNGIVDRWSWDDGGRLSSITSTAPCGMVEGCTPFRTIDYARAPGGAKTEIVRPDLALRERYQLDALDRVVEHSVERWPEGVLATQFRMELDAAANVISFERDGVADEREINARNQVTSRGSETLTWDANGNLRARDGLQLAYDFRNGATRATLGDGTAIRMLRDAYGRTVRQTVSYGSTTRVTDYALDGMRVLEEYSGGSPSTLSLSTRTVYGRGVDELVRVERATSSGLVATWPLQDELGSVDTLTDDSAGVIARYAWGPWGTPLHDLLPAPTAEFAPGFQGRPTLPLTGALDFRARLLLPDLARFAQEDPAGLSQGPNLYQALAGNWAGAVDPGGDVVLMQHGIQDLGYNAEWGPELARRLQGNWFSNGADPGQDVLIVTSPRHGGFNWFTCEPKRFCLFEAFAAGVLDWLEPDTRKAGQRLASVFQQTRALLDSSATRKGESLNVLGHSHGTAMILAAARMNDTPRLFEIDTLVFAGSDLNPFTNLDQLLTSVRRFKSYYSNFDPVVDMVGGAGQEGFQVWRERIRQSKEGPVFERISILRPNLGKFSQEEIPGVWHSQASSYGQLSWNDTDFVYMRYGADFAIRTPRPVPEPEGDWKVRYFAFRRSLSPLQPFVSDYWKDAYTK